MRFSAAAQIGATPKTRNAIHPGGHVPSTAIAAASASATVLDSRAGESTFNAHDVAAATSDAFATTNAAARELVNMSILFMRSIICCESFFFLTSVCMKNSMTNAVFSVSQYARKNEVSANEDGDDDDARAAATTTPTFKPCCRTCLRNTYCAFFKRYSRRTRKDETAVVPAERSGRAFPASATRTSGSRRR